MIVFIESLLSSFSVEDFQIICLATTSFKLEYYLVRINTPIKHSICFREVISIYDHRKFQSYLNQVFLRRNWGSLCSQHTVHVEWTLSSLLTNCSWKMSHRMGSWVLTLRCSNEEMTKLSVAYVLQSDCELTWRTLVH